MGTLSESRAVESTGETQEAVAASAPATGTVVWVDGTSAVVVRWAGRPVVDRMSADVPSHHRWTGHIRHDPAVRHGGGGVVGDQLERDRLRHRADHLHRVAALVPDTGDVLLLGPGSARLELERAIGSSDRLHHRHRPLRSEPSGRMTERELVARLRESVGRAPVRRVVGRA